MEENSRKSKQRNKCRKSRIKKLKIKKGEKEKIEENPTEPQKPNIEAEIYDNDKKKWGSSKA